MKRNTTNEKLLETGLRIRRERVLWGMTQEELSHLLGISTNYLGQIERGNRALSRKMEDRLCMLFHLDRNELHSHGPLTFSEHLAEQDLIHPRLQAEDIRRMLTTCSSEELQLCGHVLRSMLLYLRHPSEGSEPAIPAAAFSGAAPVFLTSSESLSL